MASSGAAATGGQAPESPADVLAFFDRWVGTNNAGQWDAFAALVHPDAEMTDPLLVTPAAGRAAVVDRARAQYAPFPDGHVDVLATFRSLDRSSLAYRWRFTGTFSRPIDPPGFAPTGARVTVEGASVLHFDGGLVRHVDVLYDTTAVARQVGAAPRAGGRLERATVLAQRARTRLRRRR